MKTEKRADGSIKLAKKALLCYGVPKSALAAARLCRTEQGKPYFAGLGTYFNVSHSGGLWACVVGDSVCGLDVQHREARNFTKIAGRFFSEKEQAFAREHGEAGFFKIWVRKEAYGKYTSEGFFGEMPEMIGADGGLVREVPRPVKIAEAQTAAAAGARPAASNGALTAAADGAQTAAGARASGDRLKFQEINLGEDFECVFCGDVEAHISIVKEDWNL